MTTGTPEKKPSGELEPGSSSSYREALQGLQEDPYFAFFIPNNPSAIQEYTATVVQNMSAGEYEDLEHQIAEVTQAVDRGEENPGYLRRLTATIEARRAYYQGLAEQILSHYPLLSDRIEIRTPDQTRVLGRITFPRFAEGAELRTTVTQEFVGETQGIPTEIIRTTYMEADINTESLQAALFPTGQQETAKNMNLLQHCLLHGTPVWDFMIHRGATFTDFVSDQPLIAVQFTNTMEFQRVFTTLSESDKRTVVQLLKEYSGVFTQSVRLPGSYGDFITAQAYIDQKITDIHLTEDQEGFTVIEGPIQNITIAVEPNTATGQTKPTSDEIFRAIQSTKTFLQQAGLW